MAGYLKTVTYDDLKQEIQSHKFFGEEIEILTPSEKYISDLLIALYLELLEQYEQQDIKPTYAMHRISQLPHRIESPSRVFYEFGRYVDQGFAQVFKTNMEEA